MLIEWAGMDGKGPYRIYDPGGSEAQSKEEASSYRQLLEENTVLRERMKGLKSLGESQRSGFSGRSLILSFSPRLYLFSAPF